MGAICQPHQAPVTYVERQFSQLDDLSQHLDPGQGAVFLHGKEKVYGSIP